MLPAPVEGYGGPMSDTNDADYDAEREVSPYDESADAEAPADDLNREEAVESSLREDGERPVLDLSDPLVDAEQPPLAADPGLADTYSDPQTRPAGSPTQQEEAAYSLEEPSEDVE